MFSYKPSTILWALSTQTGHTSQGVSSSISAKCTGKSASVSTSSVPCSVYIKPDWALLASLSCNVFIGVWRTTRFQSCCFSFSELVFRGQIWGDLWSLNCTKYHWLYWCSNQSRPALFITFSFSKVSPSTTFIRRSWSFLPGLW